MVDAIAGAPFWFFHPVWDQGVEHCPVATSSHEIWFVTLEFQKSIPECHLQVVPHVTLAPCTAVAFVPAPSTGMFDDFAAHTRVYIGHFRVGLPPLLHLGKFWFVLESGS